MISEKELQGVSLRQEEFDFIENYGAEIEYLTAFFKGGTAPFYQGHVALIADVATGDGILHEAVGGVKTMFVEVSIEGKKQITRGGVFSYYEFPVKDKRLTDQDWREMLWNNKAPAQPVWTDSFVSE